MTLGLVHAQKPISCKTDFLCILWIFTNGHLFTMASSPQSHLFSPPEQQYNVKSIIYFHRSSFKPTSSKCSFLLSMCISKTCWRTLQVTKIPQNCKMHSKSNNREKNKFILINLFFYVAEYVICLPYISFHHHCPSGRGINVSSHSCFFPAYFSSSYHFHLSTKTPPHFLSNHHLPSHPLPFLTFLEFS